MATYNKFRQFVQDLAHKVHNLNTSADTLKVMLSNTAPVNTNSVKTDITEISGGNGYTAGGHTTAVASSAQTAGTFKLVLTDVVITASGTIGPFRYTVLYNDTPTSPVDPLIAWWDYGSSISLLVGETFTWDQDGTNGVLQLT